MMNVGSMMSMQTNMAEKNEKKSWVREHFFPSRTTEELGGSFFAPTGVLLAYRVLAVAALAGMSSFALRREKWGGVFAPAVAAVMTGMLASFSVVHALQRDLSKPARVFGTLYQISATVGLILAAVMGWLHALPSIYANNVGLEIAKEPAKRLLAKAIIPHKIVTVANILPAAVFLADSLLLGAQVCFIWAIATIPASMVILVAGIPLMKAGWRYIHMKFPKIKLPKVKLPGAESEPTVGGALVEGAMADAKSAAAETARKTKPSPTPIIWTVAGVVFLAIICALVAVLVTRLHEMCLRRKKGKKPKEVDEDDMEDEMEDITTPTPDHVQPPEPVHESRAEGDSQV